MILTDLTEIVLTLLPLMNQDMLAAGKELGQRREMLTVSPGL